jgi:dTDP-4-dehydrorhamnose 3,5-epimerase
MHYQKEPDTEAKIVQCLQGSFFDVAVDLRKESGSYLKWVGCTLTDENKDMLYIPKGFAHGYITLEKNTLIQYLMSEKYVSHSGSGVRFNDPKLNIQWPFNPSEISEKDLHWSLIE